MNKYFVIPVGFILAGSFVLFQGCYQSPEALKESVLQTEKEFEASVREYGVQEGFYRFADDNAVILRGNDSLITGKENIRKFYSEPKYKDYDLQWDAEYVEVSNDGTMAYTYGTYELRIAGKPDSYKGVFHTVWKKQKDGTWKYVWD
jgi:ketosteroid isomerase-like protein